MSSTKIKTEPHWAYFHEGLVGKEAICTKMQRVDIFIYLNPEIRKYAFGDLSYERGYHHGHIHTEENLFTQILCN